MNFVRVVLLIFAVLFSGYSQTRLEDISNSCLDICPAGYYSTGTCGGSKHKCEICQNNTYTKTENTIDGCLRCGHCSQNEVIVKPCKPQSNVVCDCKEGYYYDNPDSQFKECTSCENGEVNTEYKKKCCHRKCLNRTDCPTKCQTDEITPSATSTSTTLSTEASTLTTTHTTNASSTHILTSLPKVQPKVHYILWIILLAVMLLMVFGSLLLKNPLERTCSCVCWNTKKNMEQHPGSAIFNEQHRHQGNDSTTMTINICEETPMMTLSQSPSTAEHPAHTSPLLPDTNHKAAIQEQSKHLPAFVHYEIIREVPLRRWKEFLRLLSVNDKQLDRAELEAGLGVGSMERQYQMLRLWSQQSSASLDDVFSALHYMELSGCAQQLQENLEKLQWWTESKQTLTACGNHTEQAFSGTLQDT